MASTIRIPAEIYEALRQIRLTLEGEYQSAAPSMQDLATLAMMRFINDWENPNYQQQILDELLECRKLARSNMGGRKDLNSSL